MNRNTETLIRQERHHLTSVDLSNTAFVLTLGKTALALIFNDILNATENDDLFERVTISDHTHSVVANIVKFVRVKAELNFDPNFLVK